MSIFFIGDPHLDHKNIAKFRPFVNSTEHNTQLIEECWKKTIHKRGIVYVMGDGAFSEAALERIGNLPGKKILIKGNHDDYVSTKLQAEVFSESHGIIKYKGMWLSHAPIHPDELRGKPNIHGHTHKYNITKRNCFGFSVLDKRYLNTCVDVTYPKYGNVFVTLDQAKQYFGIK